MEFSALALTCMHDGHQLLQRREPPMPSQHALQPPSTELGTQQVFSKLWIDSNQMALKHPGSLALGETLQSRPRGPPSSPELADFHTVPSPPQSSGAVTRQVRCSHQSGRLLFSFPTISIMSSISPPARPLPAPLPRPQHSARPCRGPSPELPMQR